MSSRSLHHYDRHVVAHRVERWTCDQQVVGSSPTWAKLRNNLRQVVHTYVPLSPCSIGLTWYRPRDGDALRLEM